MTPTPEQKEAVVAWVAAGDSLSTVQRKLVEQFQLSLTYRDVRFLIDDLNLVLTDTAPKADASDVTRSPAPPSPPAAEKKGLLEKAKEKLGMAADGAEPDSVGADDEVPGGAGTVSVQVDGVTLIPGALASGSVIFSDGVTAKWVVDQYGRPGFTEVSQSDYRPSPADGQAFMQELGVALQQRGL